MKSFATEHQIQATIIDWAALHSNRYPELRGLYANINGAGLRHIGKGKDRFSPEGVKLKKEGMKKGVPDLTLAVARQGYHGLYIELKRPGGTLSEYQIWWLDFLSEQGYLAVTCIGFDEAIEVISEYLGMER